MAGFAEKGAATPLVMGTTVAAPVDGYGIWIICGGAGGGGATPDAAPGSSGVPPVPVPATAAASCFFLWERYQRNQNKKAMARPRAVANTAMAIVAGVERPPSLLPLPLLLVPGEEEPELEPEPLGVSEGVPEPGPEARGPSSKLVVGAPSLEELLGFWASLPGSYVPEVIWGSPPPPLEEPPAAVVVGRATVLVCC